MDRNHAPTTPSKLAGRVCRSANRRNQVALAEQEFWDVEYDELVRRAAEFNLFGRDQCVFAISQIATLYVRHRHHWREFLEAHDIAPKPRRGPTPRSIFQPICRHL